MRSDQVEIDVGGVMQRMSLADAEAVRVALLAFLERSDLEHKALLVTSTKNIQPTIGEGILRIGRWTLDSDDSGLILRYRLPPGEHLALAYVASLENAGGRWSVRSVEQELIHRRR